jgi:LacI family transcriptional regulator
VGIEDFIRANGPWDVYLAEHGRGDRPPPWLAQWEGDGIIARVETEQIASALTSSRLPAVDLSSYGLLPGSPVVTTDNDAIAQAAFEHFVERGFRRFGYCGDSRFPWSVARGSKFAALARAGGFRFDQYPEQPRQQTEGDPEPDAIARWLGTLSLPVAVFACYDARGQQVLSACRRAGLAVPEQVAVLGVDNDEILCALSPPPLSSVAPNTHRAGWLAAELLARQLAGEEIPRSTIHLVPPVGVFTRQSSDTLSIDDPQIASALRYIRQHACDNIRVDDVLAHTPMARRTLEQRMKSLIGRSPHEEIRRVQLNRARELLSGSKLSVSEIALRCGFDHTEYFTVAFKREHGIAPNAYRRANAPAR